MQTSRRGFLHTLSGIGGAATFGIGCRAVSKSERDCRIQTVSGSIPTERMGVTLPHEHVLVDFSGAAQVNRNRYDGDEVVRVALPHLKRIRDLGCQTLVDCTPAYIGRDPMLLRRLADLTQLQILTNTGYYGASGNKYLPAHAWNESDDQLADRWIREGRDGIEGAGIRPGFIKIGVDGGPLSEMHRKLVRAAAKTHLATGLTIAAHTGDGVAALQELEVVEEAGLAGPAFIWVHAQNATSQDQTLRAAERGAWVEFDGLNPNNISSYVTLLRSMRDRGFIGQILISHDAGWYHVGEPSGGTFRAFDTIFTQLIPELRKSGFGQAEIARLTIENPSRAFGIRIRHR